MEYIEYMGPFKVLDTLYALTVSRRISMYVCMYCTQTPASKVEERDIGWLQVTTMVYLY